MRLGVSRSMADVAESKLLAIVYPKLVPETITNYYQNYYALPPYSFESVVIALNRVHAVYGIL